MVHPAVAHTHQSPLLQVKAWCYYESRLLGAHHGLISTYALETLVLYIFNLYHRQLASPLEVRPRECMATTHVHASHLARACLDYDFDVMCRCFKSSSLSSASLIGSATALAYRGPSRSAASQTSEV